MSAVDPLPVAVVIATRDRSSLIVRTLQTVLASRHRAFDVYVVDQSENDSTQNAVERSVDDARVHYARSHTRGLSAGLNCGIGGAASELIAITGDDCEVATDWLTELAAAFELDPRIGVVFGNVRPGPHDPSAGFVPGSVRSEPVLVRRLGEAHRLGGTSASMALRKSVWETLNGFDEVLGVGAPLSAAEDLDLAIRALYRGVFVYETPRAEVVHHGLVRWNQRRHLIHRNWYGTGAAFAKSLKQGRVAILSVLGRLGWRLARGKASPVAASLGERIPQWRILAAFSRGVAAGVLTPLDRASGHYRPSPGSPGGRPTPLPKLRR